MHSETRIREVLDILLKNLESVNMDSDPNYNWMVVTRVQSSDGLYRTTSVGAENQQIAEALMIALSTPEMKAFGIHSTAIYRSKVTPWETHV